MPGFHMGIRDLNSDPYNGMTLYLLNYLSPQRLKTTDQKASLFLGFITSFSR